MTAWLTRGAAATAVTLAVMDAVLSATPTTTPAVDVPTYAGLAGLATSPPP
jgi:hypothetical protein